MALVIIISFVILCFIISNCIIVPIMRKIKMEDTIKVRVEITELLTKYYAQYDYIESLFNSGVLKDKMMFASMYSNKDLFDTLRDNPTMPLSEMEYRISAIKYLINHVPSFKAAMEFKHPLDTTVNV